MELEETLQHLQKWRSSLMKSRKDIGLRALKDTQNKLLLCPEVGGFEGTTVFWFLVQKKQVGFEGTQSRPPRVDSCFRSTADIVTQT